MSAVPGTQGVAVIGDTETTGFDPDTGDRIVEIGLIRVRNMVRTGERLHLYINPERDIPQEAVDIHGVDNDRVAGCPVFHEVARQVAEFIGDFRFIAHNARFDVKFLNAEFERAGFPEFVIRPESVVDSREVFVRSFPGARSDLNGLCSRYKVDNSGRKFHGALLDAELLTDVWLAMNGGAQMGLAVGKGPEAKQAGPSTAVTRQAAKPRPSPLRPLITSVEAAAHVAFLEKNGLASGLWLDNIPAGDYPVTRGDEP